jgi:outer membrane protein assembly factor BamE
MPFRWHLRKLPANSADVLLTILGMLRRTSLIQTLKVIALIGVFTGVVGCNNITSLDFPGVYKIGIPQGNIITQEMVDQLRPGMTKRQVIFVMGTPLVRDPFHQNRWDYIYSYQPGGGERGQERVSVFFQDDLLVRFTGDFTPTQPEETIASSGDEEAGDSLD